MYIFNKSYKFASNISFTIFILINDPKEIAAKDLTGI